MKMFTITVYSQIQYYSCHYKHILLKLTVHHPHIYPSREMNMTTPMNCVKRMSGVKKDHTGHSAMLKLQGKYKNTYKYAILQLVRQYYTVMLSQSLQRKNVGGYKMPENF